jgi:hypothetical protein
VDVAWFGGAGPEGEAAGEHDGLDVRTGAVLLPGVPGVDVLALCAGHGLGEAAGLEDLAVEDDVGGTVGEGAVQGLAQARGLRAVAEPAQREECLVTASELPAPGRGAPAAALGGQQPGQAAKQFRGHVGHGTIGDHVESWWRKGSVESPLLPGLHGRFRPSLDCPRASPERTSHVVKDRLSDPLSLRSPQWT